MYACFLILCPTTSAMFIKIITDWLSCGVAWHFHPCWRLKHR